MNKSYKLRPQIKTKFLHSFTPKEMRRVSDYLETKSIKV